MSANALGVAILAYVAFPVKASLFLPVHALRFGRKRGCAGGVHGPGGADRIMAMGSFSIWHWMLFGAVALLLFGGKGKISDLMGDVAKGVKSFKKGLAEDDEAKPAPTVARTIENHVGVEANDIHKVG
jgi:sec-independent protein translocase protein TatA